MRTSIARVLTTGFAIAMSLVPMVQAATAPVGTLSGDEKVKLNGKNLTSAQVALPGDIVEAPGAATGTLHLGHSGVARLTATARATVERSGQEVWVGLQTGYVSVGEGDQPMSVRAHGGKITAASGAVFDVAQVKETTYITAVKGSAIISDGGLEAPESVKEGTTVTVAFLEPGTLGYAPQGSGSGKSTSAQTCNDPCAKGSDSKECKDFKALKKQCTPLRKACAKDSKNCPEYGKTCQALAGCAGYPGVTQAGAAGTAGAAGAASASAAAASASAASAAAGAAAATGASVAATSAAAAAAAAAGIAGASVAASQSNTTSSSCTSVSGICP